MAIHEGRCIAETLYNDNPQVPDHRDVATAVFTTPELGTVGLTEEEARNALPAVDIYKTRFRPLKHTLTSREETIFMKLVVDRTSDRVVGCHMVGSGAGEAVQLLGIAVKAGATKAQFDATMAVHPDRGGGVRHHVRAGSRNRCRRRPIAHRRTRSPRMPLPSRKMLARRTVRAYSTATTR